MKELVAPDLEAYAEAHSMPESDVCRRLREETYRVVAVNPRVTSVLVTIRDGVLVVRFNQE